MDCIFCKIISGEIPSAKVYEDEFCFAFKDIAPQAPVHIVLVPKKHFESLAAVQDLDQALLGHLMLAAAKIARDVGIEESGYRVVTNAGKDAGQTVFHLHIHIMGGGVMGALA